MKEEAPWEQRDWVEKNREWAW